MEKIMSRLTPKQNRKKQAVDALRELEMFLAPRLKEAETGNLAHTTAQEICKETLHGQQ